MQGLWQKVFLVNLDRRPDRLEQFHAQPHLKPWPFAPIERWQATDGLRTSHPKWFAQGRGAWGCMMSHTRILEYCLNNNIESVLILEDDCVFTAGWQERLKMFMHRVPDDWQWLYFGGQHYGQKYQPIVVRPGVVKCRNIQRTHCYGIRGIENIRLIYRHVTDYPSHAEKTNHHIDHRYGILHREERLKVYAPEQWFCGQNEGKSDIGVEATLRFWQSKAKPMGKSPPKAPTPTARVRQDKVVLYTTYSHRHPCFKDMERFFQSRGMAFNIIDGQKYNWTNVFEVVKAVRESKLVVIWNGDEPGNDWLRRVCDNEEVQWVVAENGLLPQAGFWHLDPKGITGLSSLCDDLGWVQDEQIASAKEYIAGHFKRAGLAYKGGSYILVPVQLPWDTSIYLHASIPKVMDFVRAVREKYSEEIVVGLHPRHPNQPLPELEGVRVGQGASTIQMAQRAKKVVGQTSTVLYETLALGAPTEAWGNCPLRVHANDADRLLAAVVARQIPIGTTDLTHWLENIGVEL